MQQSDTVAEINDRYGDEGRAFFAAERFVFESHAKAVVFLYVKLVAILNDLEALRHEHQNSSEDAISSVIVMSLRAAGFSASRGTTVGGETDVLVDFRDTGTRWVGESKIYRSVSDAREGLLQLLTRYCTGRETYAGLFLFLFRPNLVQHSQAWAGEIQAESLCDYTGHCAADSSRLGCFTTTHLHSLGAQIHVTHFLVNLHHAPKDKSARRRKRKILEEE